MSETISTSASANAASLNGICAQRFHIALPAQCPGARWWALHGTPATLQRQPTMTIDRVTEPCAKDCKMSGASLQVTNVPHHVTQDEFSRLFGQAQGCIGSRLVKIGNSE